LSAYLSFEAIQNYFSEEDFVIATCQQIHKDLAGLVNTFQALKIDFSEDVYPQLETHLKEILLGLNDSNLQQFVYQVDLKEDLFLNAISAQDEYEELSFLIIQREAQKVYFKIQYS
jgi:hypothetical protein